MVERGGNCQSHICTVSRELGLRGTKISIKTQATEINFFLSDIGCDKLDEIKNEDMKKEIIYIKKMKWSMIKN
jgi:hypothetical protein